MNDDDTIGTWSLDDEVRILRQEVTQYRREEEEMENLIASGQIPMEWGGARTKDEKGHTGGKVQTTIHPYFAGILKAILKEFPIDFFPTYADFIRMLLTIACKDILTRGHKTIGKAVRLRTVFAHYETISRDKMFKTMQKEAMSLGEDGLKKVEEEYSRLSELKDND